MSKKPTGISAQGLDGCMANQPDTLENHNFKWVNPHESSMFWGFSIANMANQPDTLQKNAKFLAGERR